MDDEKIYNAILDELHANGPRQGLWAKCFAEANGNENAAKALYFKYRAQQLADQESSATAKSNSTDLAKHVVSNEQSTSHTSQNNTVVLLLLALAIAFCVGWWLFSFREKQDVFAVSVNPFPANSTQITTPRSTNQEAEKSVSQSAFTETNQSSINTADLNPKVNEFEIAGKVFENELATKLHLFKYKFQFGNTIYYSKDEVILYPLDYKFSMNLPEDDSLFVTEKIIGDPKKNQPDIVLYTISSHSGNIPVVDYSVRSNKFDANKLITNFQGFNGRQNSNIKLNGDLIEFTYLDYKKDDPFCCPSIPSFKTFKYINDKLECIGDNCLSK